MRRAFLVWLLLVALLAPTAGNARVNWQVDKLVEKAAAAGNCARRHYEGTFAYADGEGWHEFAPSEEVLDLGYVRAGQ